MATQDRFKDLEWFNTVSTQTVGVVGAGGIGSWLTMLLARAGCNEIFIFDFDTLEEHNIGGQMYPVSTVGQTKLKALASIIKVFSGLNLSTYVEKYVPTSITNEIMFSAVDNMAARKVIFERWVELYNHTQNKNMLFIDGRMLAENLQIYVVTPDKIEEYKATLFEDSEVEEQPCTAKATSHCGALIGALMVSAYTNWANNLTQDIRVVPFSISVNLPLFEFSVPFFSNQVAEVSVKNVDSETKIEE